MVSVAMLRHVRETCTRLGEHFHAVAIDLLRHGLSAKRPYDKELISMYAEQIIDVIDDLGHERASIEGESLGGWVTMFTALHHADRVDRIILNTSAGIKWNRSEVKIGVAGGINATA